MVSVVLLCVLFQFAQFLGDGAGEQKSRAADPMRRERVSGLPGGLIDLAFGA